MRSSVAAASLLLVIAIAALLPQASQPAGHFVQAASAQGGAGSSTAEGRDLPEIGLVQVVSGLAEPVAVAAPDDGSGRIFVVERFGRIRIIDADGDLVTEPFLDLTSTIQSGYLEQGLLGLAFHPEYRSNGRFFVAYTDFRTNGDTFVVEYAVSRSDSDIADPKSGRLLLAVDQPYVEHNGGTLRFGPDGYLYIGLGDGGHNGDPYDHAQDRTSLLGKLLRIDINAEGSTAYGIPPDNPFTGMMRHDSPFAPSATAAKGEEENERGRERPSVNVAVISDTGLLQHTRPEIWALGLRNPWQFTFDPATGDLYIPDVGHRVWEEVNFEAAGGMGGHNYGWDWQEGSHCYPDDVSACPRQQVGTLPVAEYAHGDDNCAIVGMGVYRGVASPGLDGTYFHADYCSGTIWSLTRTNDNAWRHEPILDSPLRINGSGQDAAGELYVAAGGGETGLSSNPYENPTGSVWRLIAADAAGIDAIPGSVQGTPAAPRADADAERIQTEP